MEDGKNNEAGYALLYALGGIVLSTLMIGVIFLFARTVFLQIEAMDRFTRVQDVQEFALQQATNKIKKIINSELKIMKNVSLGSDEKKSNNKFKIGLKIFLFKNRKLVQTSSFLIMFLWILTKNFKLKSYCLM